MTSKEMMKAPALKPGFWFVNIAPMGDAPNWVEKLKPHEQQTGLLFGYDEKQFLRKQYK